MIAEIPPNYAPATVEKAAINAVMAGAKPEYFPVILAAIEAAAGPGYGLHGSTATTAGAAPAIIVNGPVREEIGMNSGLNALGQGNRANSTIGRALRLVVRNVGGAKPGGVEQSIQGGGHKWNLTFAEREEASPWEPLHVELGYDAGDSALSMMALLGGPRVCIDQTSRTARQLAGSLALASQAIFDPKRPAPMCMFVVAPEHADVFAADGWSKNDVRECIIEDTQLPLRQRLSNDQAGAGIADYIVERRGWSEAELDQAACPSSPRRRTSSSSSPAAPPANGPASTRASAAAWRSCGPGSRPPPASLGERTAGRPPATHSRRCATANTACCSAASSSARR